jgi:hypothetical protein
MTDPSLPSYATLVVFAVILANIATAWVVLMTFGANKGELYAGAPPLVAGLSCLSLALCYYKAIVAVDVSFWASVFFAVMGLWGAWRDYNHLSEHQKGGKKSPIGK